MAKLARLLELRIRRQWNRGKREISAVAGFHAQLQLSQRRFERLFCRASQLPAGSKQENVVCIAEVADAGNTLDLAVHFREIDVRKKAGNRRAEWNADPCGVSIHIFLVLEANALDQNVEEVVSGIDQLSQPGDQE